MPSDARILVVDDEPVVRDVLSRYLRRAGFEVETAADGRGALSAVTARRPRLVLLDLMLPGLDGVEVFKRVRSPDLAVIMLTAKGTATERAVGLELGADDYVPKPFSPREVVARVRAVLRRGVEPNPPDPDEPLLTFDGLEIDPRAREVRVDGQPATLTPREFDVLHLLASNPKTVFSRERLLDELWDRAFEGAPSTVTVHIRRLREKIERDPSHPRHLVTVWGVGYRFEP